jgi:hypothetical protein
VTFPEPEFAMYVDGGGFYLRQDGRTWFYLLWMT